MSRRRKIKDYVGAHEVSGSLRPFVKRFRVRTYESETDLPVVVISTFADPRHATTPVFERIAAEVVLREFPETATVARKHDKFVHLVEHLPSNYDLANVWRKRTDRFYAVEFDDYRITVTRGGTCGMSREP